MEKKLFNNIINKRSYKPAQYEVEVRAKILEIVFDAFIPEEDKKILWEKLGLDQDIAGIVRNLGLRSATELTYPPDSIQKKTLDCLEKIEFLGPRHYEYLSEGMGALSVRHPGAGPG